MTIYCAQFHVPGIPAPQGSHTAVMRGGKPIVLEGLEVAVLALNTERGQG